MSFDPPQFRSLINRTLKRMDMFSKDATELLMLTSAHESHLGRYIRQVRGPALGVFQVEPLTHNDHFRYLNVKNGTDPDLYDRVTSVMGAQEPDLLRLESDLVFQIADARLHYYMIPEPLPLWSDILGMAEYWDTHFNRNPARGFPEDAARDYYKYVIHN